MNDELKRVPSCCNCIFGQYDPGGYEEGISPYFECNHEDGDDAVYSVQDEDERAAKCGHYSPVIAQECAGCHGYIGKFLFEVKHRSIGLHGEEEACCSAQCLTNFENRDYWWMMYCFEPSRFRKVIYWLKALGDWPQPSWS